MEALNTGSCTAVIEKSEYPYILCIMSMCRIFKYKVKMYNVTERVMAVMYLDIVPPSIN